MPDEWETCEIEATSTPEGDGCRARFWAKASSPEGAYNAGESESFTCTLPIEADYQAHGHLQALIRLLVEDGSPTRSWSRSPTGIATTFAAASWLSLTDT